MVNRSLYGHTIENFYSVIPWFVITLPLVLCLSYQLDILNLGEHIATALGARVQKTQNDLTYFVGYAGWCLHFSSRRYKFSGLIAPHIARSIVGLRYFHVVIMSGCIGSILILFSDGLARGIHPPLDIPVGVIIAIIGVPYFLFLLRRI